MGPWDSRTMILVGPRTLGVGPSCSLIELLKVHLKLKSLELLFSKGHLAYKMTKWMSQLSSKQFFVNQFNYFITIL